MPPPVAMPGVYVKYVYAVLDRLGNYWYAQNNEDPKSAVELGPDNRLADILAHFGAEGFIIATGGGLVSYDDTEGPTRLILVRAEFDSQEPPKKESIFLGVNDEEEE